MYQVNAVANAKHYLIFCFDVKFIYSEKATKFCEIFPLLLTVCTVVKSKGKISQTFMAFSEYMNFILFIQSILSKQRIKGVAPKNKRIYS